jgi:hypothetical protein
MSSPQTDASRSDRTPSTRELLQRVEARQRESAFILRAHGRVRAAATAERAASRARLTLDHPGAVRRMIELVGGVPDSSESGMLWDRALTGAITLVGADRGNVQIRHPASGALTIVAQQGFDETFLEHFALVRDTTSACGRAAAQRRQSRGGRCQPRSWVRSTPRRRCGIELPRCAVDTVD